MFILILRAETLEVVGCVSFVDLYVSFDLLDVKILYLSICLLDHSTYNPFVFQISSFTGFWFGGQVVNSMQLY